MTILRKIQISVLRLLSFATKRKKYLKGLQKTAKRKVPKRLVPKDIKSENNWTRHAQTTYEIKPHVINFRIKSSLIKTEAAKSISNYLN